MSIKLKFVFGLLLVSAVAEEQIEETEKVLESINISQPVKEDFIEAKAEVKFDDVKKEVEKLNKKSMKLLRILTLK